MKIGLAKKVKNQFGKYTWKTILNSDGSVKLYNSKADARNWVHDHGGIIADGSYRLIVYRSEEVY